MKKLFLAAIAVSSFTAASFAGDFNLNSLYGQDLDASRQAMYFSAPIQPVRDEATTGIDVTPAIKGYPSFVTIEQDPPLKSQFPRYMKWLYDLKIPDALLVYKQMEDNVRSLDALATIFHEKVELAGWMRLGHKFEDIMTVEYYQEHYMGVYPVAHREAMFAQYGLIKYFAAGKKFRDIPEFAYVLVSPLTEQHQGNNAERMARTARYNPEFQRVVVTPEDIKTAMAVFEAGGYKYKDPAKVASDAEKFIADSKF